MNSVGYDLNFSILETINRMVTTYKEVNGKRNCFKNFYCNFELFNQSPGNTAEDSLTLKC